MTRLEHLGGVYQCICLFGLGLLISASRESRRPESRAEFSEIDGGSRVPSHGTSGDAQVVRDIH